MSAFNIDGIFYNGTFFARESWRKVQTKDKDGATTTYYGCHVDVFDGNGEIVHTTEPTRRTQLAGVIVQVIPATHTMLPWYGYKDGTATTAQGDAVQMVALCADGLVRPLVFTDTSFELADEIGNLVGFTASVETPPDRYDLVSPGLARRKTKLEAAG